MLDDLQLLHTRDSHDAIGVSARQWQYLLDDFDVQLTPSTDIRNVVIAGMGGSGWPGLLLGTWPQTTVPVTVVSNYDIPPFINEHTLFISSSYSGNTEETIEALGNAERAGAYIVVIASGGKLAELAHEKQLPLFALPTGIQPRMATTCFLKAFTQILSQCNVSVADPQELTEAAEWLRDELSQLTAEIPTSSNLAKQIALEIVGKTAIVYAGPKLYPAAHKWKICFNENAKNTAWANFFPEFSHNEFIGWSGQPLEKPFAVIEIRSNLEHPRVQKRFEVTEQLLSGKRPAPIVVVPKGETVLRQMLWAMAMGDFVASYLAVLNGIDPTPVELVERLKKELNN